MSKSTEKCWRRSGVFAWRGALLLAVVAGTLHITQLFSLGLSEATLIGAGRGVILLLVALGLAGNALLALGLAFLFTAPVIMELGTLEQGLSPVVAVELSLLLCTLVALLTSVGPPRSH